MAEPNWVEMVRLAHKAVRQAEDAVMDAFPLKSRWSLQGCEVVVTGPGEYAGNVWVSLVGPPYWQKCVSASELKPLEGR